MKTRWMAAALAACALAVSAAAAEPQTKDEKKPDGAKPPAEAPKPPPEVEKLSYFVGPWKSEGQIKAGPMGAGGATEGRDVCRWMPGNFFIGCLMASKGPAGSMQVQAVMGYDREAKVYRWWSFDNLGRAETATGTLKDGTWTWLGETKLADKTVKSRYTIADMTSEGYTFDWATSPDGKTWTSQADGKVSKMAMRPTASPARSPGTPGAPATPVPGSRPVPTPEKK